MKLLTADIHLDDNPQNEYRWKVFQRLKDAALKYGVTSIYILGDAVDRKDRHSAVFVNRLVAELKELARIAPVRISRGNHDTPLRGPAFWEFLYLLTDVFYITDPTPDGDVLILPFTPNPMEDWRGLNFRDYKALFLHVTVTGAISENGRELEGQKLPLLPRSVHVYSGDIHTPQTVKNLTYVGAPHPVKYGDSYPCRFLVLNDDYEIAHEVILESDRKLVIEVNSLEELAQVYVREGDRARIRFNLSYHEVDKWGEIEASMTAWAKENQVQIVNTEVIVDTPRTAGEVDLELTPEQVLYDFAEMEDIPTELLEVGISFLQEARG